MCICHNVDFFSQALWNAWHLDMEKNFKKEKKKLKKNTAAFCPKKRTACGLEVQFFISALPFTWD